jgi:hypothetical protein
MGLQALIEDLPLTFSVEFGHAPSGYDSFGSSGSERKMPAHHITGRVT